MIVMLSLNETAEMVDQHPMAVRSMVAAGTFPKFLKVPGRRQRVHFAYDEVMEWIGSRKVQVTIDKAKGTKRRGRPLKVKTTKRAKRRTPVVARQRHVDAGKIGEAAGYDVVDENRSEFVPISVADLSAAEIAERLS